MELSLATFINGCARCLLLHSARRQLKAIGFIGVGPVVVVVVELALEVRIRSIYQTAHVLHKEGTG